jgi:hypothetical protein
MIGGLVDRALVIAIVRMRGARDYKKTEPNHNGEHDRDNKLDGLDHRGADNAEPRMAGRPAIWGHPDGHVG